MFFLFVPGLVRGIRRKPLVRYDLSKETVERIVFGKTPRLLGLLLALVLLFGFCTEAKADKASIADIVVTNTRDDLLLYFVVRNCFTPEMTKAIEAGITTTFTFVVKLYEAREMWWDRRIARLEFSHDIQYDSLKRIYNIRLSERENGTVKVKDFSKAKKLMSEVVALKLTKLQNLRKGAHYRIKIMAELDRIRLPFHLHDILFFLSLWDFETDWYTVDFRY